MGATHFKTADLALSAFLQARGHEIAAVLREGGRGVFVFPDTADLRQDILAWGNNKAVSIPVRGFVNAIRDLKGLAGST